MPPIQIFSNYNCRYKFFKRVFPTCFLLLALLNIENFVSLENNQSVPILPINKEDSILLINQFLTDRPFFIIQILLSIFIWLITFKLYKNKEIKQTSKILWFFYIIPIIFLLTPAIPNQTLIGMYAAFQIMSAVGVYIGIKQTSNLSLISVIINYIKK